jgi:hypothetical protein
MGVDMAWLRRLRQQSAGMRKFLLQFKPNKDDNDVAKRNKQKAKASRSGKSPYASKNKSPYQYSPAYYAWKQSVTGRNQRWNG